MKKYIDMHTHTNYSDGELSPDELIKLAIANNIGTLAITDHDTLKGIQSVDKSKYKDIRIINGIELSAKVDKGRMHILGYGIDINDRTLNEKMIELKNNSFNSVIAVIGQVSSDYGIRFDSNDLTDMFTAKHNLGRPDIAKLLVKYGYAESVQDAFDKYLIAAYDKTRKTKKGISYDECLDLINNSNGIPVLAHPKSLQLEPYELEKLIRNMISCGLKGIEVYHSSHTKEEMRFYYHLAKTYNLLISGGSDFHGKNVKPDIELGRGKNNNIRIRKLSVLNKLD